MKRSLSVAAATIPLVSAGLVGITAAPAAADCGHNWSNKDADSGTAIWSDPTPKLRTGPHSHCNLVYWIPGGTKLYYHCYTSNAAGNTWTHARRAGTNKSGWIWDGYLQDGGSNVRC